MKFSRLVTLAVVAIAVTATTSDAQRPLQGPQIGTGGRDGGRGIHPCSSLKGPGSCPPGPAIDVTRYIPPSDDTESGGLRLRIRPIMASVFVDGRYAGRVSQFDGNFERLVLTAGSHSVVIRAPKYEPLKIDAEIRAGHTTLYRGALTPARKE